MNGIEHKFVKIKPYVRVNKASLGVGMVINVVFTQTIEYRIDIHILFTESKYHYRNSSYDHLKIVPH